MSNYIDWKEEQEDGWVKCKKCGKRLRGLIPEIDHWGGCVGKEEVDFMKSLSIQELKQLKGIV